jgi:hypothetical protein
MSTTPANTGPFRYCGRVFSEAEIEVIRGITEDPWHTTRKDIARAVCAALNWVQPDGAPKVVSCHVALQRMEAHGVIWLPLPTREATHRRRPTWTAASAPQPPITGTRADLAALRLDLVGERDQARLWNELVERHHYLGATPMAGAQCRYLAYDGARLLGALGFGAAAWRLAPRDRYIGWSDAERQAHLHLVVQNRRFLVLPWVQVRGLASSLLALAARRLPADWVGRNAYSPLLLETFVERPRFRGTSYAAANWVRVGQTQGRGRNDSHKQGGKPIKDIWLYPLDPRFRSVLTDGRLNRAPGPQHPTVREGQG